MSLFLYTSLLYRSNTIFCKIYTFIYAFKQTPNPTSHDEAHHRLGNGGVVGWSYMWVPTKIKAEGLFGIYYDSRSLRSLSRESETVTQRTVI